MRFSLNITFEELPRRCFSFTRAQLLVPITFVHRNCILSFDNSWTVQQLRSRLFDAFYYVHLRNGSVRLVTIGFNAQLCLSKKVNDSLNNITSVPGCDNSNRFLDLILLAPNIASHRSKGNIYASTARICSVVDSEICSSSTFDSLLTSGRLKLQVNALPPLNGCCCSAPFHFRFAMSKFA